MSNLVTVGVADGVADGSLVLLWQDGGALMVWLAGVTVVLAGPALGPVVLVGSSGGAVLLVWRATSLMVLVGVSTSAGIEGQVSWPA